MIDTYLNSMRDSLVRKISILDELSALSMQQRDSISAEEVDWDEFDRLVDKKAALIDTLNAMDAGFDNVYKRIQKELAANKDMYKDVITQIKELINTVTEKSASLMALEQRNKNLIAGTFDSTRKKISQTRVSSEAAAKYYTNMSKINYIDPQLMDKKK